jgi:DNA primase
MAYTTHVSSQDRQEQLLRVLTDATNFATDAVSSRPVSRLVRLEGVQVDQVFQIQATTYTAAVSKYAY